MRCAPPLTIALAAAALVPAPAHADRGVFLDAGRDGFRDVRDDPIIVRQRLVQIDHDALRTALQSTTVHDDVVLDVFDDTQFRITDGVVRPTTLTDFNWTGRLVDKSGETADMTLVWRDGAVAGMIRTRDGRAFEFYDTNEGWARVEQLDGATLPACDVINAPAASAHRGSAAPSFSPEDAQPKPVADVLVVYTPRTKQLGGGERTVVNRILNAMLSANLALENSGAHLTLRPIRVLPIDYVEGDSSLTDLARLSFENDGFMDDVHALRDRYGADLVALITYASNYCGLAWTPALPDATSSEFAFSVTSFRCLSDEILAHELAHNLGCLHDRDNTEPHPVLTYPYGYRTTDRQHRTIMAYPPGRVQLYFSGPHSNFNEYVLGAPEGADEPTHNARFISENARTASQWFPTSRFVADINQDDRVNTTDLNVLLASWGPAGNLGDFNNDGVVDGGDLGILLAAWTG